MQSIAGLLALMLVAVVFALGLSGPFLFDDFSNLLQNPDLRAFASHRSALWPLLSHGVAGPLGRPIALLSLAWQARITGFEVVPFKLFNLAVHLVNTVLVFLFSLQLLRVAGGHPRCWARIPVQTGQAPPAQPPRFLWPWAGLAALLWAVHPLVLTPVLYVVQRMTSMSALGVLAALNLALFGRARLMAGKQAWISLWPGVFLAGLFAVLSKETGALLPVFLLVLDATLLSGSALPVGEAKTHWRTFIRIFGWMPVALGALAMPFFALRAAAGFAQRDFTLSERLWTEGRVMLSYLKLLAVPDLRALGLYHDDIVLSTGWLHPWTTLPAWLALGGLALAAFTLRRRAPWFAFAVGFFLASQLMESTFVPLELMHEHRVYLGMLGPLLAAVAGIRHLRLSVRSPVGPWPTAIALLAPVLALSLITAQRAADWGSPFGFARTEASHHPNSPRALHESTVLLGRLAESSHNPDDRMRLFSLAVQAAQHTVRNSPKETKPLVALCILCSEAGCRVSPAKWAQLGENMRTGRRSDLLLGDLQALLDCQGDGSCHFDAEELVPVFDGLLANRGLSTPQAERLRRLRLAILSSRAPAAVGKATAP